jgi:hypothetical protein
MYSTDSITVTCGMSPTLCIHIYTLILYKQSDAAGQALDLITRAGSAAV